MSDDQAPTVGEALRQHYASYHMPADGGCTRPYWTPLKLGRFKLRLRNYRWRQQALPVHDVHHLLTGYPCTPTGEFQMAAWEFAAGRFPHACATLFCLPLVGMGAVLTPRRSFAAFVRGRQSKTLYSRGLTEDVLALHLGVLRDQLVPDAIPRRTWKVCLEYIGLVGLSFGVMMMPLLAIAMLLSILA